MEESSKSIPENVNYTIICPKCGEQMYEFRLGQRCSNGECTFWIPCEIRQKVLTKETMKQVVEKGETDVIEGFHKRGYSQTFAARLYITDNWKIKFRLNDESDIKCPKCNANLARFERGYRCMDKKCNYVLWNRFGGRQLTYEQMIMLLTEKRTDVIKGFISKKSGKKYAARIVMENGGALKFDFNYKKG